MNRSVSDILKLPWLEQADHLQSLTRKDLEIFWFQVQQYGEAFEKLKLAVFSVLRDLYASESQSAQKPERIL